MPFIVDFPIKNGDFPIAMLVYRRVYLILEMMVQHDSYSSRRPEEVNLQVLGQVGTNTSAEAIEQHRLELKLTQGISSYGSANLI